MDKRARVARKISVGVVSFSAAAGDFVLCRFRCRLGLSEDMQSNEVKIFYWEVVEATLGLVGPVREDVKERHFSVAVVAAGRRDPERIRQLLELAVAGYQSSYAREPAPIDERKAR